MANLLVDSSALLALTDRDDRQHRQASDFLRRHPRLRFVLTERIVGELATRMRARSDAERAAGFARSLLAEGGATRSCSWVRICCAPRSTGWCGCATSG